MKKRIFNLSFVVVVLLCGLSAKAQNYLASNSVEMKGDTIKIVRNGDTTIIVNGNMRTFNFDTTIVFGNDTTFFRTMVIDSLLQGRYFDRWWDEDDDMDKVMADLGKLVNRAKDLEKKEQNSIKNRKKRRCWNGDIDVAFSYGPLSWSAMNSSDDLFASPEGAYGLKFWSGQRWMLGFYTTFLPDSWVSLYTGILYQSDVFKFRNNVIWDRENSNKMIISDNSKNSKLVARYVSVPLIASLNIGKAWKSSWKVDLGVIGGMNFRTSHTGFKTKYNQESKHMEESYGTAYKNFNKFKLDAHIGVGWGAFQIYCEQALTPLFKDNTEKELYPFSFGIMLGF